MNRSEALAKWQKIATGTLTDYEEKDQEELLEWVREVAKKILRAETQEEDPDRRKAAIQRAVGLAGKPDAYAKLRALIDARLWMLFPVHDEDGREKYLTGPALVSFTVEIARNAGLLPGVYMDDDKKAGELVRQLLTKQI